MLFRWDVGFLTRLGNFMFCGKDFLGDSMKMKKYMVEVQVFDETDAKALENVLEYAFDEAGIDGVCYVEEVGEKVQKEGSSDGIHGIRTLEELQEYLEDNGWQVLDNTREWLLMKASPAGEDFRFVIAHDGDFDKAVQNIQQFAGDFDAENHFAKWMNAKRNGNYQSTHLAGLPNEQALMADALAIKQMLEELADGVSQFGQKSLGETLTAAEARSDEGRLRFVDNRKQAVLSGDALDDPGFDEFDLA